MTRHAALAATAQDHLATAQAGADDPHVAALCAMAAALLATRPAALRQRTMPVNLDQYLADTEHDTTPAGLAARAVATALLAGAADLDQLDVDDCGYPSPNPAA